MLQFFRMWELYLPFASRYILSYGGLLLVLFAVHLVLSMFSGKNRKEHF